MSFRGSATLFERQGGKDVPVRRDPVDEFGFIVKPHDEQRVLVHNVCAPQIHVAGEDSPIRACYNRVIQRGTIFSVGERRFLCR